MTRCAHGHLSDSCMTRGAAGQGPVPRTMSLSTAFLTGGAAHRRGPSYHLVDCTVAVHVVWSGPAGAGAHGACMRRSLQCMRMTQSSRAMTTSHSCPSIVWLRSEGKPSLRSHAAYPHTRALSDCMLSLCADVGSMLMQH